ncbi:MAG: HAD-IB family phosphatase [Desulfovibrio sp.]|jgi:2,3-diketo-5-methylthio-1-phosphopentane phosphatase|nr:HAD-IB family phosphatase [Desulfovibrio sp.]
MDHAASPPFPGSGSGNAAGGQSHPQIVRDFDAAGRPRRPLIVCDFDGTVTPFDVTDALLERFAAPEWKRIEQDWLDGRIGAGRCMELQVALLAVSPRALDEFLDSVPVREGFGEFAEHCRRNGLDLRVVSDGLDYAIGRILRRNGQSGLPVIANRLLCAPGADAEAPASFRLEFPHKADDCPAGVCKCRVVAPDAPGPCPEPREKSAGASPRPGCASPPGGDRGEDFLLIGDGLSDCCTARLARLTLAVRGGALERRCRERGYRYMTFTNFFDILRNIEFP